MTSAPEARAASPNASPIQAGFLDLLTHFLLTWHPELQPVQEPLPLPILNRLRATYAAAAITMIPTITASIMRPPYQHLNGSREFLRILSFGFPWAFGYLGISSCSRPPS